ncbi:unnamed protein product [Thelazia callipaeda]|uniref:C2 domain-containing protein n=1 Tax=Thelazia callipaeda TaxID=103827 RepID=A0A0N5CNZ0_THECL|nr:unnamed protein product [Thelazia callipaeda]
MDFQAIDKAMYGDVENDDELMAELLALEAEERAAGRMPNISTVMKTILDKQEPGSQDSRQLNGVYGISSLSDEDSGDEKAVLEDDPELLAELNDLVREENLTSTAGSAQEPIAAELPIPSKSSHTSVVETAMLSTLQERKQEYSEALKTAQQKNYSLRVRRYQRGLDKIDELIRKVQEGKAVDENDFPVALKPASCVETPIKSEASQVIPNREVIPSDSVAPKQIASEKTIKPENSSAIEKTVKGLLKGELLKTELRIRRESYIKNAKEASALGDKKTAFEYYTVAKQFDEAIKAVNDGQVTECQESELPPLALPYEPVKCELIPPPPKTLLEGLEQRMRKYKTLCDENLAQNNERKYRMNARILKQYEEAVKACRLNKPIDVSELPCPPGYPPLPSSRNAMSTATSNFIYFLNELEKVSSRKPLPSVGPLAASEPSVSGKQWRQKQQLEFLLKRQLQFKQAAIVAKKKGDVISAKKFLLAAKGFDKMIIASKNGLPVNIEKTPVPPQAQASAKMLKPSLNHGTSFDAAIKGTPSEVFAIMEKDLIGQVKFCEENRLIFTRLGDVTRVKMFEAWSTVSKRDLILLRELANRGAVIPKFRYETRDIPSVEVHMEIDENIMELTIMRVTDARLPAGWKPSDGYLFVKYNFSFPHDAHQIGKTKVVAATNSPEYNQQFLLTINRKMKQLQRVVRRNCLKFEIYHKGGFLRSDKLIATADCKLNALEEKACIQKSIDLMEGRKQTGGKLLYMIRIREPLGDKKLTLEQKKWLILES